MPKAPRSHFDHVTKKLVLNMDHYCPWMFNVVGYMNYRYFVLFLGYVFTACVYGVLLCGRPFLIMIRTHRRWVGFSYNQHRNGNRRELQAGLVVAIPKSTGNKREPQ